MWALTYKLLVMFLKKLFQPAKLRKQAPTNNNKSNKIFLEQESHPLISFA